MPDLPDGYYALLDPDDAATMTYWRAKNGRLAMWPAKAWYGPAKLLKRDAPADRDAMRAWYTAWSDSWARWATRVRGTLEADPHPALRRFAEFAIRCCQCGRVLTDDSSKVYGVGPECRRGTSAEFLAAVMTPQVAVIHAAHAPAPLRPVAAATSPAGRPLLSTPHGRLSPDPSEATR